MTRFPRNALWLAPFAGYCLLLAGIAYAQTDVPLTLSGNVVLVTGEAGENVQLWVLQRGKVHTVKTDPEGRYEFDDLRKGHVNLVAFSAGYAINGFETFLIESIDEAKVVLPTPVTFRTRVTNRQYEPVAGARLKTIRINQQSPNQEFTVYADELVPYGFPSIRSKDDGTLEVPFLVAGTANGIRIAHFRYAESEISSIPVDVRIDFPLHDGVRLSGRVADPQDRGVAGARVSVFVPLEKGSVEVAETLTGPEGFYTTRVAPGRYAVAAWHPDYALGLPVDADCFGNATDVTANCSLLPPVTIAGQVVGMDGVPIPWATVTYRSENLERDNDFTDLDGRYWLTAAAGEGRIRVTPPPGFVTDGYPEQGFESKDLNHLDMPPFRLKPLPIIEGLIRLPDDADPERVVIRSLNVDPPLIAVTDAEGKFAVQLDRAKFDEPVRFRAEHALRFLKGDFDFDVLNPKPIDIKLRSFQPAIPKESDPEPNPLAHMLDKPAPEWSCDTWLNVPAGPDGDTPLLTLKDLKGKVVVLTLWGGFDKRETRYRMWELNALYYLLKDVGDVAFVAIHDASYEPFKVEEFIHDLKIQYPVGCDADPFLTFDVYNVNRIPQTVLIDKQGILRYYRTDGRILELIKDLRRRN